jgi:DNA-binding transcriptional MerR regulator
MKVLGTDLLNIKEAAKELGLTVAAVHYHVRIGNLPHVRASERCILVRPSDLQRIRK